MRTSVSKSTSVMSWASGSPLRNLMAAVRASSMSSCMLPLVSNSSPSRRFSASAAVPPREKWETVCRSPSSYTSKSRALKSVMKLPRLSRTMTPTLTRSTPERNRSCCALTAAAISTAVTPPIVTHRRTACTATPCPQAPFWRAIPRSAQNTGCSKRSEDLESSDLHDVRAPGPIRIPRLETVAVLEREQDAPGQRDLDCPAQPWITPHGAPEPRVAHRRHIEERIEAQPAWRRPRRDRTEDGAAVEPKARARIASQPVLEAVEREPAEAIEIMPVNPPALQPRHCARCDDPRSRSRDAIPLEVRRAGFEIETRTTPWPPALSARRIPPGQKAPGAALQVKRHAQPMSDRVNRHGKGRTRIGAALERRVVELVPHANLGPG